MVELGQGAGIGGPAVNDLAARVSEQQAHPGAVKLLGHLVQDRGRGPAQRAVVVEVRLIGHHEVVGTEPGHHASLPRRQDVLADVGNHETPPDLRYPPHIKAFPDPVPALLAANSSTR